MKNQMLIVMFILLVIVGGGAFYSGMKYQQTKTPSRQFGANTNGATRGSGAGGASRMGFRPVVGEIVSSDDKSITVKLQDGSSKIVIIPDTASINKATSATKADLSTGTKVMVTGQSNPDGSVTAQNIQINPMMRTDQTPSPQQPKP